MDAFLKLEIFSNSKYAVLVTQLRIRTLSGRRLTSMIDLKRKGWLNTLGYLGRKTRSRIDAAMRLWKNKSDFEMT